MEFPCPTCIVLAACKANVKNYDTLHEALIRRCSIIKEYCDDSSYFNSFSQERITMLKFFKPDTMSGITVKAPLRLDYI